MKRFIKNNLKVFVSIIISGIIFGGIGVYAANTYLAHDISYTPSNENFEVTNVEDALNELYKEKSFGLNYSNGEFISTNYGNREYIELGYKPKIIIASVYCSKGYLRTFIYEEDKKNLVYDRGYSLITTENTIIVDDNGFSWNVYDSSWGTEKIEWYAFY